MEQEKKRFIQVCKKSISNKNPFITTRGYEIGVKDCGHNKCSRDMNKFMTRKTLFFPDRGAVKPSKTGTIMRPSFEEQKEHKEMQEAKSIQLMKIKTTMAMKKIKSTKFRDNLNISIEEEDKEKNKLGIQKRLKQDEVLNVLQAHFKIMLDRTAPTCTRTEEEN